MPLVALAYVALAAGLVAGGLGASTLTIIVGVIGAATSAVRRDIRGVALTGLALTGALWARAAALADEACLSRAVASPSNDAVLEVRAAPRQYVRGRLTASGCEVAVRVLVASGLAAAGARVHIAGRAVRVAPRAILIRDACIVAAGPPSAFARARTILRARANRVFVRDSALADALLLADASAPDLALRGRFADAGLVHALSVSGLHVAVIAAAAGLFFSLLRFGARASDSATILLTAVYVLVIGVPSAAVRSAVMLGVVAVSRQLQRPTSPWASLAVGALVPLTNPRTVLDLGYQLSVVGVAAIIAAGALVRRRLAPRLTGWHLTVAHSVVGSSVATIATAPLVAWSFGRVSLVAPVTNALAGPIFELLQPTLFLGLALADLPPVAALLADVAHALIGLLDAIAGGAARVPGAAITVVPTLAATAACAVAAGATLVACTAREPGRPAVAALAATAVAVWLPAVPVARGALELHMLDVGQGDAIALRTPRGRWILVDAGPDWRGSDAARAAIVPYLRRRGGAVTTLVLTHPHADHVGGAATLIGLMRPAEVWDGGYVNATPAYVRALAAAGQTGAVWRRVHPGDTVNVDGVRLSFLAPDSLWAAAQVDPNAASAVTLVEFGRVHFLLTGDAERDEEAWLLARHAVPRADVLKVGHHGSATSSTPEFLDAVRPRLALISVGAANEYGHPSPGVVAALVVRGAAVLRTDELGSIVVRSDGRRLTVEVDGEQWALSEQSSRP